MEKILRKQKHPFWTKLIAYQRKISLKVKKRLMLRP